MLGLGKTSRNLLLVVCATSASFAAPKVPTKLVDFTPYGHSVTLTVPADWNIEQLFELVDGELKPRPPAPIANPTVASPQQKHQLTIWKSPTTASLKHSPSVEDEKADLLNSSLITDVSIARAEKTTYGWIIVYSDKPTCAVRTREFQIEVYNASLDEECLTGATCASLDEISPLIKICESMKAAKASP
ncbi:MAG TPA: hypothetical protein VGG74_02240 [Kofleriaceae bacterium]|jgi:hypothetical protein